jgi:hypothetical protein
MKSKTIMSIGGYIFAIFALVALKTGSDMANTFLIIMNIWIVGSLLKK